MKTFNVWPVRNTSISIFIFGNLLLEVAAEAEWFAIIALVSVEAEAMRNVILMVTLVANRVQT
jgi:hypothetical protein